MIDGWESAEETAASASAQQEMKATVSAILEWMTDALIRRNCRFGVLEPGPKQ
jgi:hypothetical protein